MDVKKNRIFPAPYYFRSSREKLNSPPPARVFPAFPKGAGWEGGGGARGGHTGWRKREKLARFYLGP